MSFCNLLSLTVYCIWRLRSRGTAAEVDADASLELPVLKEEEGCNTLVQQTTFYIEELPRKFSYNEIRAVTRDFRTMVGRGRSGEVFEASSTTARWSPSSGSSATCPSARPTS
jgi:hypothetical protein